MRLCQNRTLMLGTLFGTTLASATIISCGGDTPGSPTPGASSCDQRGGSSGAAYCQEYVGDAATVAVYKMACSMNGGTWADVGCPRQDAVGGCKSNSSGASFTLINWFYKGGPYPDSATVMSTCAGSGTYVAP